MNFPPCTALDHLLTFKPIFFRVCVCVCVCVCWERVRACMNQTGNFLQPTFFDSLLCLRFFSHDETKIFASKKFVEKIFSAANFFLISNIQIFDWTQTQRKVRQFDEVLLSWRFEPIRNFYESNYDGNSFWWKGLQRPSQIEIDSRTFYFTWKMGQLSQYIWF